MSKSKEELNELKKEVESINVKLSELTEEEIAQVFQQGYIYKEQVIRHSVVQVAN